MCDPPLIWFPALAFDACAREASEFHPIETGGVLMGYWWRPDTAVVTATIGAGPHAHRDRHHFEPDQQWQLAEIARHYRESDRRETYLGDWHSHPDAKTGHLSYKDRSVLRRIINTPAARAETPLMLVFHGPHDNWQGAMWKASLKPRRILWPKLGIEQATIRLY